MVEGHIPGDIEASPPKLPAAARLLGSLGLKRAPLSPSHRPLSLDVPGKSAQAYASCLGLHFPCQACKLTWR